MKHTLAKKHSSKVATNLNHAAKLAFDDATVSIMTEKANQFSDAFSHNLEDIPSFKDGLCSLDYASIPYAVLRMREALNLQEEDDISITQLSRLLLNLGVVPIPVGWGEFELDGESPRTSLLLQNNDGVFQWCYINVNLSENSIKLDLARNIALLLSQLPNDERSRKIYIRTVEEFAFQLVMPEKLSLEIYKQVRSRKTTKTRAQKFFDICLITQIRPADLWMRMSILAKQNKIKPLDCLRELIYLEKQGLYKDSGKPIFSSNDYKELKNLSADIFGSYFYHIVDAEIENMPIIEQFDFINTLTDMPLMGNIH